MKTIEEIKEEYAKEFGFTDGWKGYSFNYSIDPICDNQLDEIATRYAASQTEAMVKDILELREQVAEYLDDQKFQRRMCLGTEEEQAYSKIILYLQELLEKTKHYQK